MVTEEVYSKNAPLETTVSLNKVLGARVLTDKSKCIGKVKEVRIDEKEKSIEGIVVNPGILKNKIYIGKDYFESLSPEGVILSMEPSVLLRGRKVVDYEGEVVGKVTDVTRTQQTNNIKSLTVHSFWRGTFIVPVEYIKSITHSIMLRSGYNVPKKRLYRRSD